MKSSGSKLKSDIKLKAGLIGSGFAAKTLLFSSQQIHNFEVVGLFGGKLAPSVSADFNCKFYDNFEQLLDSGIHILLVASPHATHFDYAYRALKAGLNVFVEKPFVPSLSEGLTLINCAREGNLKLSVNHFQRFRIPNDGAKRLLSEGVIGKIDSFDQRLVENPQVKDWQRLPENLGFLFGYGVHAIDTIQWVLSDRIVSVDAKCYRDITGIERCTSARLTLNSGISGTLFTSDFGLGQDSSGSR